MKTNYLKVLFIKDCITHRDIITPALADDLLHESGCQQVSSGLQDSSQYFDRSYKWCDSDGLSSSSDF